MNRRLAFTSEVCLKLHSGSAVSSVGRIRDSASVPTVYSILKKCY